MTNKPGAHPQHSRSAASAPGAASWTAAVAASPPNPWPWLGHRLKHDMTRPLSKQYSGSKPFKEWLSFKRGVQYDNLVPLDPLRRSICKSAGESKPLSWSAQVAIDYRPPFGFPLKGARFNMGLCETANHPRMITPKRAPFKKHTDTQPYVLTSMSKSGKPEVGCGFPFGFPLNQPEKGTLIKKKKKNTHTHRHTMEG